MKYARYLLVLPLGLIGACSDSIRTEVNANDPAHNGANGNPGSQQGNGADVQTQGASLFQGAGTSGAGEGLGAEIPPSTAHDCVPVGISAANPGNGPAQVTCFYDEQDDTALSATLERRLEIVDDKRWLHLRLTFDPGFVDNSYGETAIGWGDPDDAADDPMAAPPDPMAAPPDPMAAPPDPMAAPPDPMAAPPDPMAAPADPGAKPNPPKKGKNGHTFKDLVGSDHAEFQLFDKSGELTMQFKVDYIEPSDDVTSGYACAGVTGGEGKMIVGESDWILGATTSLDRNLNGCGLSDYLIDSPATDEFYTPNPDAPAWDYRVVYEVWVAEDPFGDGGFGDARIEYVHASPSKDEDDTLIVVPGDCPDPGTPDAGVPTSPPDAAVPPVTSEPDEPTTPPADAGQPTVFPPQMAR